MYEVSLNDSSLTSLTPARIMRNSQTRRKRQTSGFTTALAVDPIIDELLISDDTLGDILLCMRNFSDCTVYVNRSVLETNSMRANVGKFRSFSFTLSQYITQWLTLPSTVCCQVCQLAASSLAVSSSIG